MDIQSPFVNAVTPGLSYDNVSYWQNDSGYHTSYTPGSLECSDISGDNLKSSIFNGKIGFTGQFYTTLTYSTTHLRTNENYQETPQNQNRRGIKRAFQEASESTDIGYTSVQTPTSVISGGLHKLRFNDTNKVSSRYSSVNLSHRDYLTDFCNENLIASFPSTPIKKSCRSNCLISSPFKIRPVRNLDFEIHSISCDKQALQPVLKTSVTNHTGDKKNWYKQNQDLDIITMLFQNGNYLPPISKIFSYLSNEDIDTFISVSPTWQKIWKKVDKEKQEYLNYLKTVRENQENKMSTPKNFRSNLIRPLMEIQNVLNNHNQISSPISPPKTPGTNRFSTYTKAASMDSRKQLSCVRCQYPAKITEETSGEEWVECTSLSCAYQYCRLCKCERHPGKSCIKYDLDGPSPSKRKKNICAIGTKKSRRNLRRLL